MTAGRLVRLVRTAGIPYLVVWLLAACAPAARVAPAPRDSGDSTLGAASVNPALHARLYALSQELSQEQERKAALQEQVDAQGKQIEQLHAEVQQLRDQGAADGAAPSTTAPAGTDGTPPAPLPDAPPAAGATTANVPSAAAADGPAGASAAPAAATVVSLRAALSQEQERREAAETQLARLREETSVPPYGGDTVSASDFAAAKQEIVELRRMLDGERAERERLAQELSALQQRAALDGAPGAEAPQDDATRSRLQQLQEERDAVVQSLKRSLASSEQRVAELEAQLTARAGAANLDGSADGDITLIRAENATLRTQLDEEHRRTEELGNKLKVATRVTDLIFNMQAQQSVPAPAMEMR